ncbi:GNAT family N-acetyltransferase [Sanguibacter inulinus]|uniref:GNAT family N-acetyltransferase n=1 Tax=Sanguibacter inulinus TaxID=60922 RepID=UPI00280426AD|nr:GNAT family protein [Sanguibacter inulinus]
MLRPWQAEDLPVYREWLRPHHEWHLWDGPYYARPTDDEADEIVARRAREIETDGAAASTPDLPPRSLVVANAADGTFWGTVSWYWESQETEWARIGVVLHDPAVRGRGAGTAAIEQWTTLLFAATGWRRLDLATWSGNHAMSRVAERLGFTLEARFRKARVVRGEVYDSLVYGVLREEWAQRCHDGGAGR